MEQIKIANYIQSKGYDVNEKAFTYIDMADDWYKNKELDFHRRHNINNVPYYLERLNFGKRLCADDANLCEVIEINAQKLKSNNKIITDILKDNNFDVMYRKQLELMSATGTVGAYIRLENAELYENGDVKKGRIVINYAEARNIVILTCENNEILEVAFKGASYDKEGSKEAIVMFTLNNNKEYVYTTAYFDKNGNLLDENSIILGQVKPFAIMRVSQVNNIDDMKGYGLPKLFNAIPNLKTLELSYNLWFRDLEKSDKMVFLNKGLGKLNNKTQQWELPNEECRKIFLMIADGSTGLSDVKDLVQEYNPIIRIDETIKSIELSLSMLSLMFGYGTKKYTFEEGRFVTATEYIGSKQDQMQELNKQRYEAIQYITDIILAIRWFYEKQYETVLPNDEININFDDSYVTDKETELNSIKDDSLTFDIPQLKIKYLCEKYSVDEKTAQEWLNNTPMLNDGEIGEDTGEIDEEEIEENIDEVVTKSLNGAQTQSLINIISQYKTGTLTENQAINIISVSIGVTKDEARELIKA